MNIKNNLEKTISLLLVFCVSAGLALILVGLTLADEDAIIHEAYAPSSLVDWIVHSFREEAPMTLVYLGVFLILITPFLRTVLSLIWFILNKDLIYIAITGIVVTTLLLAMFGYISIF